MPLAAPPSPSQPHEIAEEISKALRQIEGCSESSVSRARQGDKARAKSTTTAPRLLPVSEDVRRGMIAEEIPARERRGFAPVMRLRIGLAAEAESRCAD